MINEIKSQITRSSPFYEAYMNQKEVIDAAIDESIQSSAKKIGVNLINELFSIKSSNLLSKKAA